MKCISYGLTRFCHLHYTMGPSWARRTADTHIHKQQHTRTHICVNWRNVIWLHWNWREKKNAHLKCEYTLAFGMSCISVSVNGHMRQKRWCTWIFVSHTQRIHFRAMETSAIASANITLLFWFAILNKNKLFFFLLIIPPLFESHLDHGN